MFHSRYVSLVEMEKLAQEYLELRQETETMTEITNMFTERALFSALSLLLLSRLRSLGT